MASLVQGKRFSDLQDFNIFKFMLHALKYYYPSIVQDMLVFESPTMLNASWRVSLHLQKRIFFDKFSIETQRKEEKQRKYVNWQEIHRVSFYPVQLEIFNSGKNLSVKLGGFKLHELEVHQKTLFSENGLIASMLVEMDPRA